MAKFTNASGELRFVNYGLSSTTAVKAGDPLTVPDDVAEAYACQPDVWQPADKAAAAAAAAIAKRAAAAAPPEDPAPAQDAATPATTPSEG